MIFGKLLGRERVNRPRTEKNFFQKLFLLVAWSKKTRLSTKNFFRLTPLTRSLPWHIYICHKSRFSNFFTFSALDIFLIEIALNKPSPFRKIIVWGFQKGLKLSRTTKIEGVMAFQSFENFQWKSMIFGKLLGRERVNRPRTEKNFF